MKKMLIALAAVAVATVCNAAAVSWSAGAVYTTDSSAKVGKGATAYLVTVAFFTDASGETAVDGLTGTTSVSVAGTGSKYAGEVSGFAASTKYYTQLVITTDGYEAKSDIVSFTTLGTGDTTINFQTGAGFDTVTAKLDTSVSGSWVSTASVPEPTSGLMLLLGMAGLALKRKRA